MVDLRNTSVSRGKLANGDRYIEITDNEEVIQVLFEDPDEFRKWGIIFVESIKKDDDLRQSQIIEPLRDKMHKER